MQLGPSELSRLFSGSPLQFCFLRSSMFRYVPVRFPTFRYVPVLYSTFTFRYAPLRSGLFWAFPPTIPPSTFRAVLAFPAYNSGLRSAAPVWRLMKLLPIREVQEWAGTPAL